MTLEAPVLAVHVGAGTLGLVLGPVTMAAPKRRGRHTRAGRAYHAAVLTVALTAAVLALLDLAALWWFLPIAAFSYANALVGYLNAPHRRPGRLGWHIRGMGGSYIALVTALLVVNLGEQTPIVWFLPTLVGVPLMNVAVSRAMPRVGALKSC